MEMIKGTALRILIFLRKTNQSESAVAIMEKLCIESFEYEPAATELHSNKLAVKNKTHLSITDAGKVYLDKQLENELFVFHKTMQAHNYDFALIELIINRELIGMYEFPLALIDLLPPHQKGAEQLGSVVQRAENNPAYISEKNRVYQATLLGKTFYEEEKEKENKNATPATPSVYVGGDVISGEGHTIIKESYLDKARISPKRDTHNNTTPPIPKRTSPIEMLSWIFGIIVGCILIYEFIKKIFH